MWRDRTVAKDALHTLDICSRPVTRQRGRGSPPSLLPVGAGWPNCNRLTGFGSNGGGSGSPTRSAAMAITRGKPWRADMYGGLPWIPDSEVPDTDEAKSSSSSSANGAITRMAGMVNVGGVASAISWSPTSPTSSSPSAWSGPRHSKQSWWGSAPAIKPGMRDRPGFPAVATPFACLEVRYFLLVSNAFLRCCWLAEEKRMTVRRCSCLIYCAACAHIQVGSS